MPRKRDEAAPSGDAASAVPPLSVIIPFRDEGRASWLMRRLEEQCSDFGIVDGVEFLVVDSGSHPDARDRCAEICERNGIRYLYHDTYRTSFSIGSARDYGVRFAKGKAITFLDVDLRVPADFWGRLLRLMAVFGISAYKSAFFTIPCVYLSETGSVIFSEADPDTRFSDVLLRWLHGDNEAIESMAPCSSVMIVDRLHYLSVGGHRPEFRGHGYEDFELYHRLLGEEGRLPRSDDYYRDTASWDTATFNGFRAQFSLLGRAALMSNLFVVHLWHPRLKALSFYDASAMRQTRAIYKEFFTRFDENGEHPEPLIDANTECGKTVIFDRPNSNSNKCLRDALPLLGPAIYLNEFDFISEDGSLLEGDLRSLLREFEVARILFNAPYGNVARRKIYDWCRRIGFPYLVFERGALPESWFFDERGFNADSESYNRKYWDIPISQKQKGDVESFMRRCLEGEDALEKQGTRIGGEALAARLRTGGKKVLFVPLQRPSDTVTVHMAGAIEGCEQFLGLIDEVAGHLKRRGWIVLCKRHPLETASAPLRHAQYVPPETHFLDLLELSDSVALINSGVGLYAMMMARPCFVFGQAFYRIDDVNVAVESRDPEAVARIVSSAYEIDVEAVSRFVSYLIGSFYSFGRPKVQLRKEADGSLRSVTTRIDFYELRIPGVPGIRYAREARRRIATSAPLFERFKLDLVQKKRVSGSPSINAVASVARSGAGAASSAGVVRKGTIAAKLSKLRRKPHAFFRDSRYSVLRPLRYLFSV